VAYGVVLAVWLSLAPAFLARAPSERVEPRPPGERHGLRDRAPGL